MKFLLRKWWKLAAAYIKRVQDVETSCTLQRLKCLLQLIA
jgi:hypothetical protein